MKTSRDLSSDWSLDELYYIAERAYALYLQGCWEQASILFAGLHAIAPQDAYVQRALAACAQARETNKRVHNFELTHSDNLFGWQQSARK